MRFPLHIATDMIKWQARNWWRGQSRSPLALMLVVRKLVREPARPAGDGEVEPGVAAAMTDRRR